MNQPTHDQGIGRRITRYSAILTVSGILCKILLLAYTLLAVRILGEENFGRLEYFIEIAIIFTVLLDFGLEQTVTREISRRRDRLPSILLPLLGYRIATTLLTACIMTAVLLAAAQEGHTLALILSAVVYFSVVSLIMLVRAVTRSFERLAEEGAANLIDKIVHIGLAIPILLLLPRLPLILLTYSAGALASLAIYSWIVFRSTRVVNRSLSLRLGWDWQKLALPIGLSAACVLLLHRQDTVMVNWIQDDAETGLYRAPYRLLEGLFLFPQVLAISAYPIFSRLYHEGKPFAQTASLLMRGLLILSLPIAVGGVFTGHDIIKSLMPNLDPRAGDVFVILLWSLPFIYANFILGAILNAANRQHLNVRASFAGMMSNLLLNVPAIYLFGAMGAAAVTAFSQGLYATLMMYYARDYKLAQQPQRYIAILAATAIMAAALYWMPWRWYVEVPDRKAHV